MKVSEIGGNVNHNLRSNKNTKSEKSFSSSLDLAGHGHKERQARGMLEKIKLIGKRLSASGNVSDIKEYQQAIKEYLSYILKNCYTIKQQRSFLTGNILIRVETINRELTELTNEFLKEQRDNLKIVNRINSITGLLLDLLR